MKNSRTFEKLREASSFCVNILAADQEEVCRLFASSAPGRWEQVGWQLSPSGAPILDGVVGWADCKYASVTEAGDHWFVLAHVTALEAERESLPLLFFQRGYGQFSPRSLVVSPGDMIEAVKVAELARNEIENLAQTLGVECSVVAPLSHEAVFVATANASAETAKAKLGMRVPFLPPLGTILVGHPGAPNEDEWIAGLGKVSDDIKADLRERLHRAQARGWSISFTGGRSLDSLDELIGHYADSDRTLNQERQLAATLIDASKFHEPEVIKPNENYDVLNLTAPVRRPNGEVAIALRLGTLPEGVSGRQVLEWKDALLAAVSQVESRMV